MTEHEGEELLLVRTTSPHSFTLAYSLGFFLSRDFYWKNPQS